MKYLVMECGLSYAVVLDQEGRFLKVANLNYQVGQTVEEVIPFREESTVWWKKPVVWSTAAAACVLLVCFTVFQFHITAISILSFTSSRVAVTSNIGCVFLLFMYRVRGQKYRFYFSCAREKV